MPARYDIIYAVHTTACTFLLDADGICRQATMNPEARRLPKNELNASRCLGAQYVASLDPKAVGCLVERPVVGLPMLFARTDGNGRITLVRTDNVTRIEPTRTFNPFDATSGIRTSAPELAERPSSSRMPVASRHVPPPETPTEPPPKHSSFRLRNPDYEDPDARTQPMYGLPRDRRRGPA